MSESLQVLHGKERLQENYSTQQLCLEQSGRRRDWICHIGLETKYHPGARETEPPSRKS